MNLQITDRVTLAYDAASTHFVKQSITTKINLCPLEAFGDTSKLQVGQHVSEFNGKQITCKYIPIQNELRINTSTKKQKGSKYKKNYQTTK